MSAEPAPSETAPADGAADEAQVRSRFSFYFSAMNGNFQPFFTLLL